MKKDCIFYKRAHEDNSQTPKWQYMLEYFVERYAQMAKQNLDTDTLDTQILYSMAILLRGSGNDKGMGANRQHNPRTDSRTDDARIHA